MSPEGPKDSPEVNPPTTSSAVEPLPPGSNAEEVVDRIDERIRESWKNMDSDDDTEMKSGEDPHDKGTSASKTDDETDATDDTEQAEESGEDDREDEPDEPTG